MSETLRNHGNNGKEYLTEVELQEAFPFALDALKEFGAVQIKDGKRLPGAQEKVALFGGVDQLRKRFAGDTRVVPLVLQACRQGAMVSLEIIRFWDLIKGEHDPRLSASTLHHAVTYANDHSDETQIDEVKGITYIHAPRSGKFRVIERTGFLTTEAGTRSLLLDFSRGESAGIFSVLKGLLRPKPRIS